jgi:hypothetical protein
MADGMIRLDLQPAIHGDGALAIIPEPECPLEGTVYRPPRFNR